MVDVITNSDGTESVTIEFVHEDDVKSEAKTLAGAYGITNVSLAGRSPNGWSLVKFTGTPNQVAALMFAYDPAENHDCD